MEDQVAFHIPSLKANVTQLGSCRTYLSLLAGVCAGILGLTGLSGFVFYLASSALLSVLLVLKVPEVERYFAKSGDLHDGIVGGLFTFLLFWTLAYGTVHTY